MRAIHKRLGGAYGIGWLAAVLAVLAVGGQTQASFIHTISEGTIGNDLAKSEPGTPIHLDFRTLPGSGTPSVAQPPVTAVAMWLTYDVGWYATGAKLRLSTSDTYSLPLPNPHQGSFMWYDPIQFDPALIQSPDAPITDAWKTEMADGVLDGRLWLEGASTMNSSTAYVFQGHLSVITPEPASVSATLFGAASLIAVRHRRRGSRGG